MSRLRGYGSVVAESRLASCGTLIPGDKQATQLGTLLFPRRWKMSLPVLWSDSVTFVETCDGQN